MGVGVSETPLLLSTDRSSAVGCWLVRSLGEEVTSFVCRWLVGGLHCWLVALLVGCIVGWLHCWLVGWLVGWLLVRLLAAVYCSLLLRRSGGLGCLLGSHGVSWYVGLSHGSFHIDFMHRTSMTVVCIDPPSPIFGWLAAPTTSAKSAW